MARVLQYAYPGTPLIGWAPEEPTLCQRLGALRRSIPALRTGRYLPLSQPGEPEIIAFARTLGKRGQSVLCVVNPVARRTSVRLFVPCDDFPDGLSLADLLSDRRAACQGGVVHARLDAFDAALLVPEVTR